MSEAIQAREASLKDKQIELGKQIKKSLEHIKTYWESQKQVDSFWETLNS